MKDTDKTIKIEGESYGFSPPEPDSIEGIERDAPVDPEGWRYYSDVLDGPTIAWILAYAKEHPEDAYIQNRVGHLHDLNAEYFALDGRNLPGYG